MEQAKVVRRGDSGKLTLYAIFWAPHQAHLAHPAHLLTHVARGTTRRKHETHILDVEMIEGGRHGRPHKVEGKGGEAYSLVQMAPSELLI